MEIQSSVILVDASGKQFMLCNLRDGSQWECDMEGNNWKKVSLTTKELEDKLNEANS